MPVSFIVSPIVNPNQMLRCITPNMKAVRFVTSYFIKPSYRKKKTSQSYTSHITSNHTAGVITVTSYTSLPSFSGRRPTTALLTPSSTPPQISRSSHTPKSRQACLNAPSFAAHAIANSPTAWRSRSVVWAQKRAERLCLVSRA
jgi:hypothetical protein